MKKKTTQITGYSETHATDISEEKEMRLVYFTAFV